MKGYQVTSVRLKSTQKDSAFFGFQARKGFGDHQARFVRNWTLKMDTNWIQDASTDRLGESVA